MKGKNFSTNNTGKRRKSDFYETPYSMTEQLLENELFGVNSVYGGTILEPACGNGAIAKVLKEKGYDVVAYDKEKDFLQETKFCPYIITNPPYSQAFEFILKAKKIAIDKFCFLLPLSYLHGQKRFEKIWSDAEFPLTKVYVFTRYPLLGEKLRDDGKYNTGMMVYAWFVWEKGYKLNPQIFWIDNNKFVIKNGE